MATFGSRALYSVRFELALAALEKDDQTTLEILVQDERDVDLLNEVLYQAAKGGFLKCVKTLVQAGADVDYREVTDDETVLGVSCLKQRVSITSYLVTETPCNINVQTTSDQHSALHTCAGFGSTECCQILIEAGAEVNVVDCYNSPPLLVACQHNNSRVAGLLLKAGADVTMKNIRSRDAFSIAMDEGHAGCVRELLLAHPDLAESRGGDGLYPLTRAIRDRQSHVVRAFIDSGCDINAPEATILTPLHLAIEVGDPVLVQTLVDGGVDVNSRLNLPLQGATPLMLAVVKEQADIVRVLAHSACNLDMFDSIGRTALYMATKHRAQQCMRELLWAGANPDAYMSTDEVSPLPAPTALHVALLNDCKEEAVMLIQAGCDVDFFALYELSTGSTPLCPISVACCRQKTWAMSVLLAAGAKCLDAINAMPDIPEHVLPHYQKALHLQRNPDKLKSLCRNAVRHNCGRAFLRRAQNLPLPKVLISYLMYEELFDLL